MDVIHAYSRNGLTSLSDLGLFLSIGINQYSPKDSVAGRNNGNLSYGTRNGEGGQIRDYTSISLLLNIIPISFYDFSSVAAALALARRCQACTS
jgi:hypothetical protein